METEIKNSIDVLIKGGLILFPGDTEWFFGCDATNTAAVEKLQRMQENIDISNLCVLIDDINRIPSYIETMPEIAWDLVELATNPLTIIYPGAKNLANNLISKDKTIAIRVTSESFTKRLIQRFRKPVASASAITLGKSFFKNFGEIDLIFKEKVDYIVNLRQHEDFQFNQPSVIQLGINGRVKIIRE